MSKTPWNDGPTPVTKERRLELLAAISTLTGWFGVKQARARVGELKTLEQEGLLESSRSGSRAYSFRVKPEEYQGNKHPWPPRWRA